MSIKIMPFKAKNGESLLIECEGERKTNILVDVGYSDTYKDYIKKELMRLADNNEQIDLLILTHYDQDHIEGTISLLQDLKNSEYIKINEIWINDFYALRNIMDKNDYLESKEQRISEFANYIIKKYRVGEIRYNEEEIAKQDYMTISELLMSLNYNFIINKSFKDGVVRYSEYQKPININDELSIQVIGPSKEILKEQFLKYLEWHTKNDNKYLPQEEYNLFEIYMASSDANIKSNEKLNNQEISGGKDYKKVIEEIWEKDKKFKDPSESNKTSISFILEFQGKRLLLLGDMDYRNIDISYNYMQLKYDLIKLPHHGSKFNIDKSFFEKINCNKFLICTDGSGKSRHPNLETLVYLSRSRKSTLYINYPINTMSIPEKALKELSNTFELEIIEKGQRDAIIIDSDESSI